MDEEKIALLSDNPIYNELIEAHNERIQVRRLPGLKPIEVGDIVKKKACRYTGPEAWVTVLEKELLWEESRDDFYAYDVLQPDGTIATFTDAVLRRGLDEKV
tara:strand:+ start:148 stop:453 length:306 start_codon:yes stop_codon:yes gene_type:complete